MTAKTNKTSKTERAPAGLPPARAHDLADLVLPSPGGIVSRTLVDRPQGTLTLFAFDAEQGLSEHSAPFDALVQVLAGRLRLRIGGEPVEVAAGQVCLMPAQVPHSVRALEPSRMLLVMIRG